MEYEKVIAKKKRLIVKSGFNPDRINPVLFAFERFCVSRALIAGKYAIFADCGMGKTFMQLEWAHQVAQKTGGSVLALAPLAVVAQTEKEAQKLGIQVFRDTAANGIVITNYDQIKNIDCSRFVGVVLDESSIIKDFEGATRNMVLEQFARTPYKLACTATPAPNDPMELGNHAEFLGVMTRTEMLAMYFVHDGGETGQWRLKRHAEKDFYRFVASWAVMFSHPRDIGFDVDGYDLPPIIYHENEVKTPKRENGKLVNDVSVSATGFNAELRVTKMERLELAADICNKSDKPFIVWVKQDEEADLAKQLIPDAVEVRGSTKNKEQLLLEFAEGKFRVLITKTKIAQFGLNYQHCPNQIFASLDFSFEGLYQAIRRSYRFGQKNEVNIYIITTDTMQNVVASIERKQKDFKKMQLEMTQAVCETINEENQGELKTFDTQRFENEKCEIACGDSVVLMREMADNSIGLTVTSTPFADLYTYSDKAEDMGNSRNYQEFFEQFIFIVKELYRVTAPGRIVCVHCMDLPIQKGKEGYIGLRHFSDMLIEAFCQKGEKAKQKLELMSDIDPDFMIGQLESNLQLISGKEEKYKEIDAILEKIDFFRELKQRIVELKSIIDNPMDFILHSRVTIWKNPVTEMQRTKALGLLHKQVKKDSTMSRVGIPDYVLIFRKPGENENPVENTGIDVDQWQKIASPVWMDIDYGDTLNGWRNARAEKDEKHICPLQLPTIERLINLYSKPGDVVFDPFGGIGSTPCKAIEMGRKAKAFELKESYYAKMKQNVQSYLDMSNQLSLFD